MVGEDEATSRGSIYRFLDVFVPAMEGASTNISLPSHDHLSGLGKQQSAAVDKEESFPEGPRGALVTTVIRTLGLNKFLQGQAQSQEAPSSLELADERGVEPNQNCALGTNKYPKRSSSVIFVEHSSSTTHG